MNNDSIERTAFSTPEGHYEILRLPFGLKDAPAKMMYQVLGILNFVEIFLDDIKDHSKTFDVYMSKFKMVINRLRKACFKINDDKCTWGA